jgi:hypothetical protein
VLRADISISVNGNSPVFFAAFVGALEKLFPIA